MGHLRGWVVLVAALFLAAGCHAQEEIAELQRVKGDLKACRNGLNYLEDDKDICMKRQAELQASIKGLQIRLTNAEVHEQMLEVCNQAQFMVYNSSMEIYITRETSAINTKLLIVNSLKPRPHHRPAGTQRGNGPREKRACSLPG